MQDADGKVAVATKFLSNIIPETSKNVNNIKQQMRTALDTVFVEQIKGNKDIQQVCGFKIRILDILMYLQ